MALRSRTPKSSTTIGLVRDEYDRLRPHNPNELAWPYAKLAALSTISDAYPAAFLRSAIRDVCDMTEEDL